MRYEEFSAQTKNYPVFGGEVLSLLPGKEQGLRLQLSRWVKSGKVIRLKRGLYTLPQDCRKVSFSLRWLANTMYSPSYVSLEYALSWHDLIPERVTAITSVSTLKTATIANPMGKFTYRNLNQRLFFGFEEVLDEFQKPVLMATKEKALLDYAHFYSGWSATPEFLTESIRLQQLETLDKRRLKEYSKKFNSKKIFETVDTIVSILRK